MRLKIYTNDLATRIGGGLFGVAMLGFGVHVLASSLTAPDPALQERALWYGVTLAVAGLLAGAVSWLAPDLRNIWCNSPRFFRPDERADGTSAPDQ